ncbi:MAG: hypothetical protein AAF203_07120 [Pseudomonadota bacterium]
MFRRVSYILVILIAGLSSGCGEAFRTNPGFQEQDFDTLTSEEVLRSFEGPLPADRTILLTYEDELRGREAQTRRLGFDIKAFDLAMLVDEDEPDEIVVASRVVLGCDRAFDFSATVAASQLASGQRFSLGIRGNYSVRIQCSKPSCNEMVAAVTLHRGGNAGTVLIPVIAEPVADGVIPFVARNVEMEPYFRSYRSSAFYGAVNNCEISGTVDEDDELSDGDSGSVLDDVFGNLGSVRSFSDLRDVVVDAAEPFIEENRDVAQDFALEQLRESLADEDGKVRIFGFEVF